MDPTGAPPSLPAVPPAAATASGFTTAAAISDEPVYKRVETSDGIHLSLINKKQSVDARIKQALAYQPKELLQVGQLTDQQLQDIDYIDLSRKEKLVYMDIEVKGEKLHHESVAYLSPEETYNLGLWDAMKRLQLYYLTEFEAAASAAQKNPAQHKKKKGRTFDFSITTEPGHKSGSIRIAHTQLTGNDRMGEMLQVQMDVAVKCLQAKCPNLTGSEVNDKRWMFNASVTPGPEGNKWLTSVQVNLSNLNEDLAEALKESGDTHMDSTDDITLLTVLPIFNHYPDTYHPGRFNLIGPRITIPFESFGVIIFSGRQLHNSTGMGFYPKDLPLDSPLRCRRFPDLPWPVLAEDIPYGRITVPVYPRVDAMDARRKEVNEMFFTTDKAVPIWGSKRRQQEFLMLSDIRKDIETGPLDVSPQDIGKDATYYCERFSWVKGNGVKERLPLELAEAALDKKERTRIQEYHMLYHKALLGQGFGSRMPDEDNPASVANKATHDRRREFKKQAGKDAEKIQCTFIIEKGKKRGSRCQAKFWPRGDGNTGCKSHKSLAAPAGGGDEVGEDNGQEVQTPEEDVEDVDDNEVSDQPSAVALGKRRDMSRSPLAVRTKRVNQGFVVDDSPDIGEDEWKDDGEEDDEEGESEEELQDGEEEEEEEYDSEEDE